MGQLRQLRNEKTLRRNYQDRLFMRQFMMKNYNSVTILKDYGKILVKANKIMDKKQMTRNKLA